MGSIFGAMEYTKVTMTTAATSTINLGFIPRLVLVLNVTDSIFFVWVYNTAGDGLADATAWQFATAGDQSLLATNGITAYAGSSTASAGITLGTSIGGTNDDVHVLALR